MSHPGTSAVSLRCRFLWKSGPGDIVHSFSLFLHGGDSGMCGSSDADMTPLHVGS